MLTSTEKTTSVSVGGGRSSSAPSGGRPCSTCGHLTGCPPSSHKRGPYQIGTSSETSTEKLRSSNRHRILSSRTGPIRSMLGDSPKRQCLMITRVLSNALYIDMLITFSKGSATLFYYNWDKHIIDILRMKYHEHSPLRHHSLPLSLSLDDNSNPANPDI